MKIVFSRVMAVMYALFAGLWGYLLINSGIWAMSRISTTDSGIRAEYTLTFTAAILFITSGLVIGLAVWLLVFSFKKHQPLWTKVVSIVWLCVNSGLVMIIPSQCTAPTLYSLFHNRIVSSNYSEYMALPFTATFFVVLSLLAVVSVAIKMQRKAEVISNESV